MPLSPYLKAGLTSKAEWSYKGYMIPVTFPHGNLGEIIRPG